MADTDRLYAEFQRLLHLRMKPAPAFRWVLLKARNEWGLSAEDAEEAWERFQREEGIRPITPLD